MLIEEQVRQGENLLDALKHTEHMRARDAQSRTPEQVPSQPRTPAPDGSTLAALSAWNEMK